MGIYVKHYWGDWNYNRYLNMDLLYIFERDCWREKIMDIGLILWH